MDLTALDQAAARSGWPEFARLIVSMARPSAGLTVRLQRESTPLIGYYGGLPRMPVDLAWPRYGGAPMSLLAQLDCAAVRALLPDGAWTLPATGWLLCFHEDGFTAASPMPGTDDGCAVLHVPADAPRRQAPPAAFVTPALPLTAVPLLSLPGLGAAALQEHFHGNPPAAMDVHDDLTGPRPSHRLLGWPDDEYFDLPGHRPLLQLDAEAGTEWGECVNVSFWLPEEDWAAGRLDRVCRVIEMA